MSRYKPKTNYRGSNNSSKVTSSCDKQQPREKEVNDIIARSVLRSGLSYESFVKVLIQSALSRLSIWTQADLERLLMMAERLKQASTARRRHRLEQGHQLTLSI